MDKGLYQFTKARQLDLEEPKRWIEDGNENAKWYWKDDDPFEEGGTLDSSFEFFTTTYGGSVDEITEDNIIRFCGSEIKSLWDGYKDDSLENRQNHCACLYKYIKDRIESITK